jgi:hypothetical protein
VSGWLRLIDLIVVLGVAVILPLALGGPALGWRFAGAAVAVALLLPVGWGSAVFVLPFVAVALAKATGPRSDLPTIYALVAAVGLFVSRLRFDPFGFGEPIGELAGVHFTYAGAAALSLARGMRVTRLITAAAPPIVAIGFFTGSAVPQIGGAVLMTIAVWSIGARHARCAADATERGVARVLLAVSAVSITAPMVLALSWAAGEHWPVPALSISDMVRTHGLANAFGFTLCGLIGRRMSTTCPMTRSTASRAGVS